MRNVCWKNALQDRKKILDPEVDTKYARVDNHLLLPDSALCFRGDYAVAVSDGTLKCVSMLRLVKILPTISLLVNAKPIRGSVMDEAW